MLPSSTQFTADSVPLMSAILLSVVLVQCYSDECHGAFEIIKDINFRGDQRPRKSFLESFD